MLSAQTYKPLTVPVVRTSGMAQQATDGCDVVRYFHAKVPRALTTSRDWSVRVTHALSQVADEAENSDPRWGVPPTGWRNVLEGRAHAFGTGFVLEPSVFDVSSARNERERSFAEWCAAQLHERPQWVDDLGELEPEFLDKLAPQELGPRQSPRYAERQARKWTRVQRHYLRAMVIQEWGEAEFAKTFDATRTAQYPMVPLSWAKYECAFGFYAPLPCTLALFGVEMSRRPANVAQTRLSRLAWCATRTLWLRNLAFELLEQAGAQAAGRECKYEGRLWWLSREIRAGMRACDPDRLVGPVYSTRLAELLEWIDKIHWSTIQAYRNKVPSENHGGRAPVFASADFVCFDPTRWCPKLPAELTAPLLPGDTRLDRGLNCDGDVAWLRNDAIRLTGHNLSDLVREYETEVEVAAAAAAAEHVAAGVDGAEDRMEAEAEAVEEVLAAAAEALEHETVGADPVDVELPDLPAPEVPAADPDASEDARMHVAVVLTDEGPMVVQAPASFAQALIRMQEPGQVIVESEATDLESLANDEVPALDPTLPSVEPINFVGAAQPDVEEVDDAEDIQEVPPRSTVSRAYWRMRRFTLTEVVLADGGTVKSLPDMVPLCKYPKMPEMADYATSEEYDAGLLAANTQWEEAKNRELLTYRNYFLHHRVRTLMDKCGVGALSNTFITEADLVTFRTSFDEVRTVAEQGYVTEGDAMEAAAAQAALAEGADVEEALKNKRRERRVPAIELVLVHFFCMNRVGTVRQVTDADRTAMAGFAALFANRA